MDAPLDSVGWTSGWNTSNLLRAFFFCLVVGGCAEKDWPGGVPWARHMIDGSRMKSEGIRLGNVNGDGLVDLAVGWESEDESAVYLNPGIGRAHV